MHIRTLIDDTPLTANHLYEAVFAAGLAQAYGGAWCVVTAADRQTTRCYLQAYSFLNLFWDEGPELDERDPAYELVMKTPEMIAGFDQEHHITHEIVQMGVSYNSALQAIRLPVVEFQEEALATLLEGDYLPTAVQHTLLTLGWPAAIEIDRLSRYKITQQLRVDSLVSRSTTTFELADLRQFNQRYIAQLPADMVAERIKPYLEEWYGPMPAAARWLVQLAELIRADLTHFEDAPDIAGWAFADGWELTAEAETWLARESTRPILVPLVAELAHIVLLDRQTADSILNGLRQRLGETFPVNKTVATALTGQVQRLDGAAVLAVLGKAQALSRLGELLGENGKW